MNLEEYLLVYPGFSAEPGVCHVVVARDAPDGAAVLVGDPHDNPGTSPTNALEQIAAIIAQRLFAGELAFRLYQYEPEGLPTLTPTFYVIDWRGARAGSMPTWEPVEADGDAFVRAVRPLVSVEPYAVRTLAGRRVIDATDSGGVVDELRIAASS